MVLFIILNTSLPEPYWLEIKQKKKKHFLTFWFIKITPFPTITASQILSIHFLKESR